MSSAIRHFYKFECFLVDIDQRVLLREYRPVPLTPKVFETLLILLEQPGRIVEKNELMNRLWPDSFVEEANLTFNIQQVRKALGDNARHPVFIETVARRGYRFVADVEEVLTDSEQLQSQMRFDRKLAGRWVKVLPSSIVAMPPEASEYHQIRTGTVDCPNLTFFDNQETSPAGRPLLTSAVV